MNTKYLVIPDWEKTQHYKYRNPPWIKLYSSWLDDPTFRSLTRAEQGDFFKLLLIATKYDHGRIPDHRKYLREVGQIAAKSIEKFIKTELIRLQCGGDTIDEVKVTEDVQGDSASTLLASRTQDALPEGETETETERQGKAVNSTWRSGDCQSAKFILTGLNQLNKSTPSPSPKVPASRQSRKNGPFDDIKNAVEKLLSKGVVDSTETDKIAQLAGITPKQVKAAMKQLLEDGSHY